MPRRLFAPRAGSVNESIGVVVETSAPIAEDESLFQRAWARVSHAPGNDADLRPNDAGVCGSLGLCKSERLLARSKFASDWQESAVHFADV